MARELQTEVSNLLHIMVRERGEPEHQDLNQLLPLGYNACGRARRGSSLRSWENTVKPYKRARKSEHDAQCQGESSFSKAIKLSLVMLQTVVALQIACTHLVFTARRSLKPSV